MSLLSELSFVKV